MSDFNSLGSAIISGDLSKLNAEQKTEYYNKVCEHLGISPITRPFEFLNLNGKLTLYCTKSATDQLRKIYNVSVKITSREKIGEVFIVTALATLPNGRTDESVGAVPIDKLTGEKLSNALMKAETKARRRVTLSICGLSLLDDSELESLPRHVAQLPAPKQVDLPVDDNIDYESEIERLVEQVDEKTKNIVIDKMAKSPSKSDIRRIYEKLQTMRGTI